MLGDTEGRVHLRPSAQCEPGGGVPRPGFRDMLRSSNHRDSRGRACRVLPVAPLERTRPCSRLIAAPTPPPEHFAGRFTL